MVDLGTLGGLNSSAMDINNHGDIVGHSELADGATHAVLWRDGRLIDLGTLGGDDSFANSINEAGEIVGVSRITPGSFTQHAFLWRAGEMKDLEINDIDSFANGINNSGQVVGGGSNSLPWLWTGGESSVLSTRQGQASAINDRVR